MGYEVLVKCQIKDHLHLILPDRESVELTTRYYNATIPLWRDILPLAPPEVKTWEEEWSTTEASEVVEAVGAWIIYVTSPHDTSSLVRCYIHELSEIA